QLCLVLSTKDTKNYLEHHIPAAPVAPPRQQVPPQAHAAHDARVKGKKEKLKAMYFKQAEEELLQTVREFHTSKQEEGQPKNQKNKLRKAAKGSHGKGKGKIGYASNNAPFAPKLKTPPPPNKGLRGSKKLKPGPLSLYVGDGHRAAVEAIGTYHLELPSGLVIVLNNYHYAPSITRGMERKPYSHQVKRAKDLLRLIHTDVCGPFKIVSRQGASYFVTFTDDFSRYGYVYLLKHKHEVFETFKVFQKEVENQLGKTIKSLHSDREDRVYLYIDAEEHVLGDLSESANYKDALLDPESKKWLDAMNVEMQSMKDNDLWVLVELPPNARTVGSK
nr:retrotransposon protein, putative, Ty1-copia subclass [Tanacetum cinerariifolium]